MCNVCIATGRMTIAEWDQIQPALLDIATKIVEREEARRGAVPEHVQFSDEDQQEDETLDGLLATLIGMAAKYEDLPLRQAHQALAREIMGAGERQLAHGIAAIATRIYRNSAQ